MWKRYSTAGGLIVILFSLPVYAYEGYGVCITPQNKSEVKVTQQVFKLLEDAGVKWVRLGFLWNEIETEKGKFIFEKTDEWINLAKKHNINVLGLFARTPEWASASKDLISPPKNTEDWKRFVREVVIRYKGKIKHWEVWNEPDINKFWKGTPEEYIVMLREAYKVIKEIDPSIKVLSAGLDGNAEKGSVYLDKLLTLGMADYCDIIAFHPYGKTPEKSLERVKKFISIMEKHKVKKPLWFTEIGWQAGGWEKGNPNAIVSDEETKALYLKQVYQLLGPYSEVIFWYRAVEGPKVFGLIEIDRDGSLKLTPSYNSFKDMTRRKQ